MPLISKDFLRLTSLNFSETRLTQLINESRRAEKLGLVGTYDVFLCHSYEDREAVKIIYFILTENLNLSVYVDWIQNPELDRSKVTTINANIIRGALARSNCLIYTFSLNSTQSKWMPWELGYSDAQHGRIALLPMTEGETGQQVFRGQEYLGLYPYVSRTTNTFGQENLYLHDPDDWYVVREISEGIFKKATRGWDLRNMRP